MYPARKEAENERRFDHLNAAQKEAVLSEHPHNIVTASAGTGKTSVLTHRIAYLVLEENIMRERILALAFNRKGAVDIRRKLSEVMDDRKYLVDRVKVFTFHSVMLWILEKRRGKQRLLVQDWEKEQILVPLLWKHHLKSDQRPEVLARLSLIKNKKIPAPVDDPERRRGRHG